MMSTKLCWFGALLLTQACDSVATTRTSPPGPPASSSTVAVAAPVEPADAPARLAVGGMVEGVLAPGQAIQYPLALERGDYLVEVFARAPSQHKCTAAPGFGHKLVDRDGAIVFDGGSVGTWDNLNWQKAQQRVKVDGGSYALALRANDWCRVHYRVRITRAG